VSGREVFLQGTSIGKFVDRQHVEDQAVRLDALAVPESKQPVGHAGFIDADTSQKSGTHLSLAARAILLEVEDIRCLLKAPVEHLLRA
jgi:hypothetical protein